MHLVILLIFCVLQVNDCRLPQDWRFLLVNAGPEVGCGVKEHVTWWQNSTCLCKEPRGYGNNESCLIYYFNEQEQLYWCRICQCLSFHWENKINVTFPVYMYIDLVVCTKLKESIKSFFIIDLFLEINLSREA